MEKMDDYEVDQAMKELSAQADEAKALRGTQKQDLGQKEQKLAEAQRKLWDKIFADMDRLFDQMVDFGSVVLDTRVLDTALSITKPMGRNICVLKDYNTRWIRFYTGRFNSGHPAVLEPVEAYGEIHKDEPGRVFAITETDLDQVQCDDREGDIVRILTSWDTVYPALLKSAASQLRHANEVKKDEDKAYAEHLDKECEMYGV